MEWRQVVTMNESGHVEIEHERLPALPDTHLLVKTYASLISAGREVGQRGCQRVRGGAYRPVGYQCAGEVVAVGRACDGFHVGQRVACMGLEAKHSDWVTVPQNLAIGLPDHVGYDEGAFVALAGVATHAVRRATLSVGEDVVVVGLGVVGQLVAQLCRIAGLNQVLAFDPIPLRVERARNVGVSLADLCSGDDAVRRTMDVTAGEGIDCGFVCFGGDASTVVQDLRRMIRHAPDGKRWGRIVIPGGATVTCRFGASMDNIDIRSSVGPGPGYRDSTYEQGGDYPQTLVRWPARSNSQLFVRWLETGRLNVKDLITLHVSFSDVTKGFDALMDTPESQLGVIITYP